MRITMAIGTLVLLPSFAVGQAKPGSNLAVDVVVSEIAILADRARVEYVLTNSAESAEQLFIFSVDAPSPVLSIPRPMPEQDWNTGTSYRTLSVARWAVLGDQMAPGESSPALFFEAVGLPAIVAYRVLGYTPPAPLTDTNPVVAPSDFLNENGVLGKTVGIEPFPADLSPASLVSRLHGVTMEACGELGWIDSRGVCNSLTSKLENAAHSLARGQTNGARGQLEALLKELEAQRGKHVSDGAYWLLRSNVEFLLAALG